MKKYLLNFLRPFLLGLGFLVLGHIFYVRLDLTSDQRYRLHVPTKQLLSHLEEPLQLDIYLTGELPKELKQLKRATQELLEECRTYAAFPLRWRFVDLNELPVDQKKAQLKKLVAKGIQPTNLYTEEKGQRLEKLVFPGALLSYGGQTVSLLLLKGNKMTGPAQMVNQSIEGLEYEFATALDQLIHPQRKQVGLLRGHGEPNIQQLSGLINALEEHYTVQPVALSAQTS